MSCWKVGPCIAAGRKKRRASIAGGVDAPGDAGRANGDNRGHARIFRTPLPDHRDRPAGGLDAPPRSFPALDPQLRRAGARRGRGRSEEHTSELPSLMRISYAVFCLTKKTNKTDTQSTTTLHARHQP